MTTYRVGYFVGSLATASINRKLAKALVRLAPKELMMTEIPFRDLPLYSYDYDKDFPPATRAFKEAIARAEASSSLRRNTTGRYPADSKTRSTGQAAPIARIRSAASRPPSSGHHRARSALP